MFIVFLKFSDNKQNAARHMDQHNAWVKQGFDDGVFLLAGSILPGMGGAILAHNCSSAEIEQRVGADPFVQENIVKAEISEIAPAKLDERLAFLG